MRKYTPEEYRSVLKAICDAGIEKRYVFYNDLYKKLGLNRKMTQDRKFTGRILCDISKKSNSKYKVMITAIVVNKANNLPGEGFYQLAEELGRMEPSFTKAEKIYFCKKEQRYCYDFFKKYSDK